MLLHSVSKNVVEEKLTWVEIRGMTSMSGGEKTIVLECWENGRGKIIFLSWEHDKDKDEEPLCGRYLSAKLSFEYKKDKIYNVSADGWKMMVTDIEDWRL